MFSVHDSTDSLVHARRALVRPDLYRTIHKALRCYMTDVLVALGRLDVDQADACDHTLLRTARLLDHLAAHLEHENAFIHPAIEQSAPGAAERTASDHDEHAAQIAALRERLHELQTTSRRSERQALALCLYREFAAFVGENFSHMQIEEGSNMVALWSAYDDLKLSALHTRIVEHVDPRMLVELLPWMLRALNPDELVALFQDMRHTAPRDAYRAALELARGELDASRHDGLVRSLMAPSLAAA